jgi:hypothetical protein
MRSATSTIPRFVGECRAVVPSIHVRQAELPLLWLHLLQAGTKFAISEM